MFNLIPTWAYHYEAFWLTIRRRNLWFIKMRYGIVILLPLVIYLAENLLDIIFLPLQKNLLYAITAVILAYNVFFHSIRKYLKHDSQKFNPLHLSILQMIADLFTLTAIVYLTGSIESPLLFFFVIHIMVGSLILPDYLIYSFAVLLIIGFWTITVGEFYSIIPNFHLNGYLPYDLHGELSFVLGVNISFALVIILIVIISNRMASQLYIREQQLLHSLDKINAAEKEKQKYISGIVHEIRTPLSAVQAYLDLVLQKFLGPLDEVVEQKLIRARKRSEEAIELANDVLKISKLHSENSFVMEEIDIPEILDTVIKRAKINAEAKGVELYLGNRIKEKHTFQGDPLLIQIALSNIIANSIKYNSVDGIVEIDVYDDKNELVINVSDNGLGIPESEMEKVFTDFYRASNVRKAGLEGSGLGLSVVKQIIERHGGTINIKSPSHISTDKYPGTEVRITLPFVK